MTVKIHCFFSMLFLLTTTILYAQNSNSKEERENFKMKLPIDGISFYESYIKQSNYFPSSNVLQIYPGERIFVEVELDDTVMINIKVVKENIHPQQTFEISFSPVAI